MIVIEVHVQPARVTAEADAVTLAAIDRVGQAITDDIEARLREFGSVEPFAVILGVGVVPA